jgi:acetyl esterase/lipase
MKLRNALFATALAALIAVAQTNPAKPDSGIDKDTTEIDKDGTARITRVIPVPRTVSPEAQALLATGQSWCPGANSPAGKKLIEQARQLYPVTIEEGKTIAGVKVAYFRPASGIPTTRQNHVLINLHGGGFRNDSNSYVESIPIANLSQTLVISVYYRLSPPNVFPAAVDDVLAVYRELLRTYKANNIGIYGTSTGSVLTAETAIRIRKEGLPQPGALGIFAILSDASQTNDSRSFFSSAGLVGEEMPVQGNQLPEYLPNHDPRDPMVSPIYADLKGFPPTLCMTGTRDRALVGTVNLHRALRRAGVETELVMFEAMPHAFWFTTGVPESAEALQIQASFLNEKISR